MKYNYPQLIGKCVNCLGCMRLEDEKFTGTNECKWADDPREKIKEIKGEQMKI